MEGTGVRVDNVAQNDLEPSAPIAEVTGKLNNAANLLSLGATLEIEDVAADLVPRRGFAVSMWVKHNSTSFGLPRIQWAQRSLSGTIVMDKGSANDVWGTNTKYDVNQYNVTFTSGVWRHILYYFDMDNGQYGLFVNGAHKQDVTSAGDPTFAAWLADNSGLSQRVHKFIVANVTGQTVSVDEMAFFDLTSYAGAYSMSDLAGALYNGGTGRFYTAEANESDSSSSDSGESRSSNSSSSSSSTEGALLSSSSSSQSSSSNSSSSTECGQTELLLHGDGSDGGTTFTDSSSNNFTVTRVGSTVTDTGIKKFGTASLQFPDKTTDWLTVANNAVFSPGADNFTVEGWFYTASLAGGKDYDIYGHGSGGVNGAIRLRVVVNGSAQARPSFAANIDGTEVAAAGSFGDIAAGSWYHVMGVRDGTNIKVFLNGTLKATTACGSGTMAAPDGVVYIGAHSQIPGSWSGSMQLDAR
jgi:hypothetical protein